MAILNQEDCNQKNEKQICFFFSLQVDTVVMASVITSKALTLCSHKKKKLKRLENQQCLLDYERNDITGEFLVLKVILEPYILLEMMMS